MTLLVKLAQTSAEVAATASRLAKVRALSALLQTLEPDEIPVAVPYLAGEVPQGKLGVAYGTLHGALNERGADAPALTVAAADRLFAALANTRGKGATARRAALLRDLFTQATPVEQGFLARLITGELRQGALLSVMMDAVADASGLPASDVRRAVMSAGGVGDVARAALTEGAAGLTRYTIRLMHPVLPMLSQSANDTGEALRVLGRAAFEWKLDGARVQVHKAGPEVRVYTRNLNDVTARVPEVVDLVSRLPAASLILDGEVIALHADGRPRPFQMTMRRFGRKLDIDGMRGELPLSVFFFDCLLRDSEPLIDQPAEQRFAALQATVPQHAVIPRIVTDDPAAAVRFMDDALAQGHEGVMAKALNASYEAGRRGAGWLKIKPANTLDLVVLAAEWGNGRRAGWLSNLHFGARDAAGDGFVMLGKTFKGLTDEMLAWQTRELLQRETHRRGHVVFVQPELVVEVAFNEVQASRQYPGGLALRFARVKGYRPDKSAREADTIDTVRAIHDAQTRTAAA